MSLAKTLPWSLALYSVMALAPWRDIAAQANTHLPDAQSPRVVVIAAFDDSAPELAIAVASTAQQRAPQLVSPRRLRLVRQRDIASTLDMEWIPKRLEDYRDLAKLVRAVGMVVLTVHGRRDSLDVIGTLILTKKLTIDTVRFRAPSPAAAVDSLVARLLADPRFHRGAT